MARDGERGDRGDRAAWFGARNSGPYAGGTEDTGPVDIAAVRRDDALIDAIASDGPVQTDSPEEFQLAALLADWRAELVAPPLPDAPDLDEIVAAVNQEIGARQVRSGARARGRLRLVRPIMGAAAALALVFGGMTAFSYNAEPGDPLWRVKEVVFSEQAETTVVARADNDLSEVESLLSEGRPADARVLLDEVRTTADQVSDPAKQDDLMARWAALVEELEKIAPEIASQITSALPKPTDPAQTSAPKPSTPPTGAADDPPVDPTILLTPQEPGTVTQEPGTADPTAPTVPPTGDATAPTNPPTDPPTQEPTQEQPTAPPPTTIATPTAAVPTGGGGVPTGGAGRPTVAPPPSVDIPDIEVPSIPVPAPAVPPAG